MKRPAAKAPGDAAKLAAPDEWERFFGLHWQELCDYLRFRYGASVVDPEEVAQAAFAKLSEAQGAGDIKNPRAFLFATARNIAIDEFRKSRIRLAHKREALQPREESGYFSPESVLVEKQRLELMNNVVMKLPKMQRAALLLHRLDRLTYSQIASKHGVSETTVRRHVAAAVEKIHKALKRAERANR